eukprot:8189022-Alexandrium_andersonii.AAC.1
MSASLVGSEMCIRDRASSLRCSKLVMTCCMLARSLQPFRIWKRSWLQTCTHLALAPWMRKWHCSSR